MNEKELVEDLSEETTEQAPEENVVSIFKNLTQEKLKNKPKIEVTAFDEIEQKNQDTRKKVEEERKKNNKNVIRSYRLK